MRFLVDAQLPPALAVWIAAHGHPARAVRDLGLQNAVDSFLLNFAEMEHWIVVTKDEDFAARIIAAASGPQVLWLRIGNCTNPALFSWLEPLWPAALHQLQDGSHLVELKRVIH